MVRRGMRDFLDLHDDLEVVGEAADGAGRARVATARLRPDVVVMDLVMPGLDGIAATAELKARHPAIEVVAITSFIEEDADHRRDRGRRERVPAQGRRGGRPRRGDPGGHGGEVYLDPAVAGIVARRMRDGQRRRRRASRRRPASARLTARERDVLAGVARGLSNRAIADELGMAERTARTHVSNILAKLGLDQPDAGRPVRGRAPAGPRP